MGNKFASGKYAHGFCDICAFKVPYTEMQEMIEKDARTGVMVCPTCWNESHPQLRLGELKVNDPEALQRPRPDLGLSESRVIVMTQEQAELAAKLGIL